MHKEVLREKISAPGYQYNKGTLLGWVNALPNTSNRIKPDFNKKGDVYMHPIFGHPYVFLEKKEDYWVCGLLTSNSEFEGVLEQCKGRFFNDSYFTEVLFTIREPIGSFMGVYDYGRHLSSVLIKLKRRMI